MGIDIIDNTFKGLGKAVGGLAGGLMSGTGGDKSTSTPAAAAAASTAAKVDEPATKAAENQGKLNPLILTGPQGVLDPANPGKKLLLGQ